MKLKTTLACATAAAAMAMLAPSAPGVVVESAQAQVLAPLPPMPKARAAGKHVNRVIDLWSKGQPVYYTGAGAGDYEAGKKLAQTKADYINYEMESGAFDFSKLREFMKGLVDGGPTKNGYRTPVVVITLPIPGTTDAVRANTWMFQQALAAGVHGILLCNAESPEAVKAMVEATRYPFAPAATGLNQGTRGNGSQGYASTIWGLTPFEYMRVADPWPLNPDGEIILGVKIENPRADAMVETTFRVPGIAFAEWGPGDNSFYIMGRPTGGDNIDREAHPEMNRLRARILSAAKVNNIKFLNACNEKNVVQQIKDGTMICTGGDTPAADIGRAFSKRDPKTDPW
jgi:4-hydroxy-2-oxoheptanedioate aldolase